MGRVGPGETFSMRRAALATVILAVMLGAFAAAGAADARPACRLCGACCGLQPVCVCEPVTKKKPKTTYSMKCEPVCVPGPCLLHHGKATRHRAGCTGPACDGCCGAATVRMKKVLLKKVTEEEVDAIERKVEYVCCHCAGIEAAPTCSSCSGHGPEVGHSRPWWRWLWPR
jgi:uncharacterized membrane protein YgdD (TMEM256/DUF423 family)